MVSEDSAPGGRGGKPRKLHRGFSPNEREALEKLDLGNTISKLDEAGLLLLAGGVKPAQRCADIISAVSRP